MREWLVVAVLLPFAHNLLKLYGLWLLDCREFVIHGIYCFAVKIMFVVCYQLWALFGLFMAFSDENNASEQKVTKFLVHAMYVGIVALQVLVVLLCISESVDGPRCIRC